MSKARPRPLRNTKNKLRFFDAADRTDVIDSLSWSIDAHQRIDSPGSRLVARRLIRRRRTLRGLVIGA